jgi:preprotein translocase subunit YajC
MANLLLPVLLLVVMYFFVIAPQKKKQKAHSDLLSTLGPGDEVVTSGGIYGGVTEVNGDDVFLEIAPDIEIKVARRAIADRVFKSGAAAADKAPMTDKAVPPAEANDGVEPDEQSPS